MNSNNILLFLRKRVDSNAASYGMLFLPKQDSDPPAASILLFHPGKEYIHMKTTSQVAKLTGVSPRTLQYYDKIGLLRPSKLTQSGYRLYDEEALQMLQQILFFKELGFPLKKIREIHTDPDFDRIAAFRKQKELLLLKRDRIDRLIQLLSRLEKGEQCMSFQEFDLSDYITALEDFKHNSTHDVIQYFGSVEAFDRSIQKIKDHETEIAKLAIQQFGSIEKFTEAMKHNLVSAD